jgi:hypothetical protein
MLFAGANPLILTACHSQSGCTAASSVLRYQAMTAQAVGPLRYPSASNSDHHNGLIACALWCSAIQMRCTKRLSISDADRALHFRADVVLYPRDPRAHGVQWVHHVLAQTLTLWVFLGCGLTRPF